MKTKKHYLGQVLFAFLLIVSFTACKDNDKTQKGEEDLEYVLTKEDVSFPDTEEKTQSAKIGEPLEIEVTTISDKDLSFKWYIINEEPSTRSEKTKVSTEKNLNYAFLDPGTFQLSLEVSQGSIRFEYPYPAQIEVGFGEITPPSENATPYITKVVEYLPAVGQFTNDLPKYVKGDTQEIMNEKALAYIGGKGKGMISLGGFGGYVTVGFDHTIENVKGKRDFRVIANAFDAADNPDPNAPVGGSCEPGVIMVAYDSNKNGEADEWEWFEISGSAHKDPTKELWYDKAVKDSNDVRLIPNYEITYFKPEEEPANPNEPEYIRWEDNQGQKGYKAKNNFHKQSYYPQWVKEDKLTFKGTRLPQNGVDESGEGSYYVLYKFRYGYADNELNNKDDSAVDIDWAVDKNGNKVHLPGVDFIKVYTGVDQENGWLGECSTEITRIEDLHLLGVDIDTRSEEEEEE